MKELFVEEGIKLYDNGKFYNAERQFNEYLSSRYALIIKNYKWLYSLDEDDELIVCKALARIDNRYIVLDFKLSRQYDEESSKFTVKYYPLSELRLVSVQDQYNNKGFSISFNFSDGKEDFVSESKYMSYQKDIVDFVNEIMKSN